MTITTIATAPASVLPSGSGEFRAWSCAVAARDLSARVPADADLRATATAPVNFMHAGRKQGRPPRGVPR